MIEFTDEEKIIMFDQIAECFYKQNFGRTSKADIDLLMFHFYIQKLINQNKRLDGTIDYNNCSDYKISKDLCITQQQVRNLKIKKQLKYPEDFVWQKSLAQLMHYARLEKDKIAIYIPDPNLYYEIENFINEKGAYIEKTFNNKTLKMRIEYFLELSIEVEDEKNKKEIIKALKKQMRENQKDEKYFEEKNIGKSLIDAGVNITSIIANISSVFSAKNDLVFALIELIKKS